MSAVDTLADKAQAAAERLARSNGLKAKLAHELAQDAAFLRKVKPRLVAKRARGEAPTDELPSEPKHAPSGSQLGTAPSATEPSGRGPSGSGSSGNGGGPSPFLVVGAALALGVILAKWIDWRGYAYPRW